MAQPVQHVLASAKATKGALVLLAPATPWFFPEGSLAGVDVPILMRTGEKDTLAEPIHGQIVERGLRDPTKLVSWPGWGLGSP